MVQGEVVGEGAALTSPNPPACLHPPLWVKATESQARSHLLVAAHIACLPPTFLLPLGGGVALKDMVQDLGPFLFRVSQFLTQFTESVTVAQVIWEASPRCPFHFNSKMNPGSS